MGETSVSGWASVVLWTTVQSTLITITYLLIGWRIMLQRRHLIGIRLPLSLYVTRALMTHLWLLWPHRTDFAAVWLCIFCVHTQYAHQKDGKVLKMLLAFQWLLVILSILHVFMELPGDFSTRLLVWESVFVTFLMFLLWWLLFQRKHFYRVAMSRANRVGTLCWCRPLRAMVCMWAIVLCATVYIVTHGVMPRVGRSVDDNRISIWILTCTSDVMVCAYLWLSDIGFLVRIFLDVYKNRASRISDNYMGYQNNYLENSSSLNDCVNDFVNDGRILLVEKTVDNSNSNSHSHSHSDNGYDSYGSEGLHPAAALSLCNESERDVA